MQFIVVVTLLYTQLAFGALINTDNDPLLSVPANWGFGGHLDFADQSSILLGYLFYIMVVAFPFVVAHIVYKQSTVAYLHQKDRIAFKQTYG